MADTTWDALLEILDLPPTTCADQMLNLIRRLATDRTPATEQLLFDAVPAEIPRAELERRITLAMRRLHYASCGHTSGAFLILRDGVDPATRTRCAPREVRSG